MQSSLKILLCVICLVLPAYCSEAHEPKHLECWHCSSETVGAEAFCSESFNKNNLPDPEMMKQHDIKVLRNCTSTTHSEHERPVCRKTVEKINGKLTTKRFCYYTNKSDALEHCMEEPNVTNVERIFCEDCITDQCNGVGVAQRLATWLSQLLPFLLAKVISN